jgi:hypothetical protein
MRDHIRRKGAPTVDEKRKRARLGNDVWLLRSMGAMDAAFLAGVEVDASAAHELDTLATVFAVASVLFLSGSAVSTLVFLWMGATAEAALTGTFEEPAGEDGTFTEDFRVDSIVGLATAVELCWVGEAAACADADELCLG